jgi:predicted outer membrane repeat protein
MGRKIFTLIFILLALISISAVSAADLDGNNNVVDLSDDGDALSIENDVDTINDLDEDASGDDILSTNDDNSVAAGEKMEVYDAKYVENGENSTILGYGYRPATLVLKFYIWEHYDPEYDCYLEGYVKDESGKKIEKGTVDLTLNDIGITFELDKDDGCIDYNFGILDAGTYVAEAFYHDDSGEYLSDTYKEKFEVLKYETEIECNNDKFKMFPDDKTSFIAEIVRPNNDTRNLTYSSSNPEVVSVTPGSNFSGAILWAHSIGSAVINISVPATKNYDADTKQISVIVRSKEIPTIIVNTPTIKMGINETRTIDAELIPHEAGSLSYKIEGSTEIASVTPTGTIVPKRAGFTYVEVSFPGNQYYSPAETKIVRITVTDDRIPTKIDIKDKVLNLKVNDEVPIGATLIPADAGELNYRVRFPDTAIIRDNKIVAVGVGETQIDVVFEGNDKYAGSQAELYVYVTPSHDAETYKVYDFDELCQALENAQKQTAPTCIISLSRGDFLATKSIELRQSAGLKNLVIYGNNRVIDGNNLYSFLKIIGFSTSLNGLKVTIENVTFKNFNAQGGDGSVLQMIMGYGEATFKNVKFINNNARNGGALCLSLLTNVNINNCEFIDNSAESNGGAVYVNVQNNLGIKDTIFSQNSARNMGGAVYDSSKTITIDNSRFLANTARQGGALYYERGTVTCTNSEFIRNSATEDGGAVYRNGPFYGDNNDFWNNSPSDFEYTGSAEGDDINPPSYSRYSSSGTGYRSIEKVTVNNHQIPIKDNKLTLWVLNQIFNKDFRNGYLLVYIDGILVFNATTTNNLTQIIVDLLNFLFGNHEIKVVFTDSNGKTNNYTENITI